MKFRYHVLLFALLIMITTACAPQVAATSAPATEAPTEPAATAAPDWQTYSNTEAGFSIKYPSTWKVEILPDQNSGLLHAVSLKGAEGGVEIHWGVGLGGGCTPEGIQTIKVAQGELQTCYGKNADGTEQWGNISKALPNTGFSAHAYTADSASISHDLVLQVISTLSFP